MGNGAGGQACRHSGAILPFTGRALSKEATCQIRFGHAAFVRSIYTFLSDYHRVEFCVCTHDICVCSIVYGSHSSLELWWESAELSYIWDSPAGVGRLDSQEN